jgi:hypothetical protein
LHPIAAACAKAVVAQVGLAMRDVWAGRQRDVDAPARVALRYFVHPEDIELQSGDPVADLALRIDAFAKANPVIVRKLDLAGSTATFRREQAERQQHAELSDRLFGGDEETLRRMAQLMPNLDPLGRSTAS